MAAPDGVDLLVGSGGGCPIEGEGGLAVEVIADPPMRRANSAT